MAWEIFEKGKYGETHWELSVINRKATEYEFLRSTYGWGCQDKIILFTTGMGGNQRPNTKEFAALCAAILCRELNNVNEQSIHRPVPSID